MAGVEMVDAVGCEGLLCCEGSEVEAVAASDFEDFIGRAGVERLLNGG